MLKMFLDFRVLLQNIESFCELHFFTQIPAAQIFCCDVGTFHLNKNSEKISETANENVFNQDFLFFR